MENYDSEETEQQIAKSLSCIVDIEAVSEHKVVMIDLTHRQIHTKAVQSRSAAT